MADFRLALQLLARARYPWIVCGTMLCLLAIGWLAGQFSPRQPTTVALDVGISFVRLLVPLLGLMQLQELLAREVERKLILSSLTYPRSRTRFLLSRFAAVAVTAAGTTALAALVLQLLTQLLARGYAQATGVGDGMQLSAFWLFGFLDSLVVLAFGTLLASLATTPNLVMLGGLGFLVIARSAATIVQLLAREQGLVQGAEVYTGVLTQLRWFVPDLSALDIRALVLYGKWEFWPGDWLTLAVMALAYCAVLLGIACWHFERRQFT